MDNPSRTAAFAEDIEALAARAAPDGRDRLLQIAGAVATALGVVIAFGAYLAAAGQDSGDVVLDNLEHNELTILAISGVALSISGGIVFLRYSLGRFLRLWLLRQLLESRVTTAAMRDLVDPRRPDVTNPE